MPHVAAVVLAAGASRRMRGTDKLLEPVGGRPVLRAVAEAALASRAAEVVVVLPPGAAARRAALAGIGGANGGGGGLGGGDVGLATRGPRGGRRSGRTRLSCCSPTCRRWARPISTG